MLDVGRSMFDVRFLKTTMGLSKNPNAVTLRAGVPCIAIGLRFLIWCI